MHRSSRLVVLLLPTMMAACAPGPDSEPLTVLCSWPAGRLPAAGAGAGPIRWIRLPADRFADWIESGRPADVLVGGDGTDYRDLEARGLLRPGQGPWAVTRSDAVLVGTPGGAGAPADWADLARNDVGWSMTLGDPRSEPAVRAWADARLDRTEWAAGYAELVRAAAQADLAGVDWPPVGPDRYALATESMGSHGRSIVRPGPEIQAVEYVGIPAASRRPDRARAWLEGWTGRGLGGPSRPGLSPLAADLLGSTLIDAHPELRKGWGALLRAGRPEEWEARLVQPPPWPPAEVLRLRAEPGGREDLDTLAAALVADPEARDWLIASWEGPRGVVDRALLDDLWEAAGGKLAREPRFRSWLRAEWAAWARQWYRWIARRAENPIPGTAVLPPDREPGA